MKQVIPVVADGTMTRQMRQGEVLPSWAFPPTLFTASNGLALLPKFNNGIVVGYEFGFATPASPGAKNCGHVGNSYSAIPAIEYVCGSTTSNMYDIVRKDNLFYVSTKDNNTDDPTIYGSSYVGGFTGIGAAIRAIQSM